MFVTQKAGLVAKKVVARENGKDDYFQAFIKSQLKFNPCDVSILQSYVKSESEMTRLLAETKNVDFGVLDLVRDVLKSNKKVSELVS